MFTPVYKFALGISPYFQLFVTSIQQVGDIPTQHYILKSTEKLLCQLPQSNCSQEKYNVKYFVGALTKKFCFLGEIAHSSLMLCWVRIQKFNERHSCANKYRYTLIQCAFLHFRVLYKIITYPINNLRQKTVTYVINIFKFQSHCNCLQICHWVEQIKYVQQMNDC